MSKTDNQIITALQKHNGNQTKAAKELGITRQTIYNRAVQSPKIQSVIDDANEELIDDAVDGIREEVAARKPYALMFVLSRLGKNRGFTERVENTGENGGPLEIIIKREDQ